MLNFHLSRKPRDVGLITSPGKLKSFTMALAAQNTEMAQLIQLHGIADMQPWKAEPFTKLIGSIASQQLSIKAAHTIFSRVLKRFSDNQNTLVPEKIAQARTEDLRACGLSNAKSRYCIGIANAVVDSDINLNTLNKKSADDALNELILLKGVGKWTAEMFLIFAIGHKDIFAVDDLGLQKGVQFLLQRDSLPDKKIMLGYAEQWQPYRSIASWYLWRLVESNNNKNI